MTCTRGYTHVNLLMSLLHRLLSEVTNILCAIEQGDLRSQLR